MLELHPEEQRLRQRQQELQEALHVVLHDLFVLQHDSFREITELYAQYFAPLEQEIQRATLANAEVQRRVELFSVRKAKGHQLDEELIRFVNDMVQREFSIYHESLRENFERSSDERNARRETPETRQAPERQQELRRLYRELVRKLHPDVNKNHAHFERFWLLVRDAYDRNDQQRLRLLHNLLCSNSVQMDFDSVESALDSLNEQNRRLEMRLDYEQRKLARLRTEEPYSLQTMLASESARSAHELKLRKQIAKLQRSVAAAETVLQEMLGANWDVKSPDQQAEEKIGDFQEEFRANTYFSMRA